MAGAAAARSAAQRHRGGGGGVGVDAGRLESQRRQAIVRPSVALGCCVEGRSRRSWLACLQERQRVMALFAKYDQDRSGSLHEGELKALLEEHIQDKPGFESHIVSDQEVRCVCTRRRAASHAPS